MDTLSVRACVRVAFIICLLAIWGWAATAAQAGNLYNFGGYDGVAPNSLVQAADGNFYGTDFYGGNNGDYEFLSGMDESIDSGTLFRMTPAGVVTVLYRFSPLDASGVNADGAAPNPIVLGKDGNLYGTTQGGGANGQGVFFKLSTNGQFTAVTSLTSSPLGSLAQGGDGTFYGVNISNQLFGLTPGGRQVFSYAIPYTGITHGYRNGLGPNPSPPVIGPDGAIYGTDTYDTDNFMYVTELYRCAIGGQFTVLTDFYPDFLSFYSTDLVVGSDGALYGTTLNGGVNGTGQVFRVTTTGAVTYLGDFGPADGEYGPIASAPLVQASDGSFYGTRGDSNGNDGVLFRVTPGSGITDLYRFQGGTDGRCWETPLIQASDGDLYSTCYGGGIGGGGTIFRARLAGSLTTLYSFPNASMANALIQATDGNLYGTTLGGGANDGGTLYRLSLDGALTPLYSFPFITSQDTDGAFPSALIQATDGLLYGTCQAGGANGTGTVFHATTGGSLNSIFSFPVVPSGNADGIGSGAPLVQSKDGSLYGMTESGGIDDGGTLFRIKTDGSFQTIHTFTERDAYIGTFNQYAQLAVAADGTLYGTRLGTDRDGDGSIYKITPSGAFRTVHQFVYSDGAVPGSLIIGSDGALYGCTNFGGLNQNGVIFKCDLNGNVTVLYTFGAYLAGSFTENADGISPFGLIQAPDGSLIVSASTGGPTGNGTILRLSPDLTGTVLHTFGTGDGSAPNVVVSDGTGGYFGSCIYGGAHGTGMIFHLASDGSYSDLYDFSPLDGSGTNANGANPTALVRIGELLYGVTTAGGRIVTPTGYAYGGGTLFQISAQGRFKTLRNLTTADGLSPVTSLLAGADGALYGCGATGGASGPIPQLPQSGSGTVFRATTRGALQVLHSFDIFGVNAGGADPYAPLIQATDGNFYGTTSAGGSHAQGTVFKLTPSGTETILHTFGDSPGDGLHPVTALLQAADGSFYGTTEYGGADGGGVVFNVTPQGVYSIVYTLDATGYSANALLQDADGLLYGTTEYGGMDDFGTTFRLSVGGAFDILHDFTGQDDGGNPVAPLTLIPVASLPGPRSQASPLHPQGARIRPLGMTGGVYHKIGSCSVGGSGAGAAVEPRSQASPARNAKASLPVRLRDLRSLRAQSFQRKHGSALASPNDVSQAGGTVFEQNVDGSVSALVSFNGQNGSNPQASILAASNGYYYGTTPNAGPAGGGTAFQLTLPLIDAVGPTNLPVTKLVTLQVAGSGFVAGSQIAVNGKRITTQAASTHLLTASVTLIAYAASPATSITITVIAPDGTVSNAYSLPIVP